MATKRCLPTRFFKDPDIMNVGKDTQLILVGLVLLADDEGRELAHSRLLSREMDYPAEQIEQALQELADNDLIVLYQGGRHRYYSLTRWPQWQTISSQKMTPSKYPAPPGEAMVATSEDGTTTSASSNAQDKQLPSLPGTIPQHSPAFPENLQGKDGKFRESPTQCNVSESNASESKGIEDEGDAQPPPNVVHFPAARAGTNDANPVCSEKILAQTTQQVAVILKIPASESLQRVVADYLGNHSISLLGEADAAREWIDDPRRNSKQRQPTPAFFRSWLKREYGTPCYGSASPDAKTPEMGVQTRRQHAQIRMAANGIGPPGTALSPAPAENPYHAFVTRRAQLVLRRSVSKQEEEAHETTS